MSHGILFKKCYSIEEKLDSDLPDTPGRCDDGILSDPRKVES